MSQFAPRVESYGAGDLSWLGSKHGTESARTFSIDVVKSAAKIVNGLIKSGEPFAIVGGLGEPYVAGTNTLAGFLLTDQSVTAGAGNVVAPLLDHGRVILSKLPSVVAADAETSGQFVFIEGA